MVVFIQVRNLHLLHAASFRSLQVPRRSVGSAFRSHEVFGVICAALNTLIGIKHLSPDPVWPRPPGKRNGMAAPKFKVDSFVSDEHSELLRLAAQ